MMKQSIWRYAVNRWLVLAMIVSVVACGAKSEEATKAKDGPRMATIYGYNYTDMYIDSFSVNGQGGANLAVSTPTGGGGGSVCCIMARPHQQFHIPVKIKWTRDREVWCELDVTVTSPAPANPEYFEVHFYQDGHVEVAVTEQASEPRVKLARFSRGQRHESGNVNNDTKFASCANNV